MRWSSSLGDRLPSFLSGLKKLRQSMQGPNILVDDPASIDNFGALLEALDQIFSAIMRKDLDEIVRLTNSKSALYFSMGNANPFLGSVQAFR